MMRRETHYHIVGLNHHLIYHDQIHKNKSFVAYHSISRITALLTLPLTSAYFNAFKYTRPRSIIGNYTNMSVYCSFCEYVHLYDSYLHMY